MIFFDLVIVDNYLLTRYKRHAILEMSIINKDICETT
jgi:hypothetical protein